MLSSVIFWVSFKLVNINVNWVSLLADILEGITLTVKLAAKTHFIVNKNIKIGNKYFLINLFSLSK
jgi:hypothetical protein